MLEPILPSRKPVNPQAVLARLARRLGELGNDLLADAQGYEAPPSESYRRTGTLGKSWSKRGPRLIGSYLVVEVASSGQIAPYNRYVRGFKLREPRQATRMAERGWQSIDTILNRHWPQAKADLEKIIASSR